MQNNHRQSDQTGRNKIPFQQIEIQAKFRMQVPESFSEDRSMAYRYAYFSDKSKSPLGIAVRFVPLQSGQAKNKMLRTYFGGDEPAELQAEHVAYYRETVHGGASLSIYTMRFAVDVPEGLLLGCFNCNADYKDEWRDAAQAMLQSVSANQ